MIKAVFPRAMTTIVLLAVALMASGEAWGQTRSLFGSGGSTGGQTGSSFSGTANLGNTFSGNQFGGQLGNNRTGATGQSGAGNTGNGFVGRGDGAAGFVGNRLAGQGGGQGAGRTFTQFNRAAGSGTRFNQGGNSGAASNQRSRIRPEHRIAFAFPKAQTGSIAKSLETRFSRLPDRLPSIGGVSLKLDDQGRVTLTGEVASAREKKLAALIVRMEPGVRVVQNELTVKSGNGNE